MKRLDKLLLFFFVINLYFVEKCVCSILDRSNDVKNLIQIEGIIPGFAESFVLSTQSSVDSVKNVKVHGVADYYGTENTKIHVAKRVARQAYGGTSLYPRLPTTTQYNYQHQPYQNQNSNYYGQSSYTNSSQQQWHPQNPSQPGYPAYTPSYNNTYRQPYNTLGPSSNYKHPNNSHYGSGYPSANPAPYYGPSNPTNPSQQQWQPHNPSQPGYPGYTPSSNSSYHGTYNPFDRQPANNPLGTNDNYQQLNNSHYGPGYPSTNPASQIVNPFGSPKYPQSTNYSGYPLHPNYGNNNFTFIPNQRPINYPFGNMSNTYHSNYPSSNRTSNHFYPSSPSYNDSRFRPGQPNLPTTSIRPNQYSANSTFNFNGTQQKWPYNPTSNFNNYYNQNYPVPGPGSVAYNNSSNFNPNQAKYPQPNQYQSNYYSSNQFNGTSTYRLAPTYNPSIPSQPPRNGTYQRDPFYYPSGTHYGDPTKVAPERFSY